MNFTKVCVLGLGYIGLPTASLLSTKGYEVLGVDIEKTIVDTINKGEIHIVEPDLDVLVKSAVLSNKLKASLKPEKADVFYICVPTPFKDNFVPDLSYVKEAAKKLIPYLKKGNLVIIESTIPPKTTELVANILKKSKLEIGKELFIAHAPERVLPGNILHELIYNDRIIGGINEKSAAVCRDFYKTFVKGAIFITNSLTAEMAKLSENAYRDLNIAFANELSMIADKLKINVWDLIHLTNKHPRVNILQPGPGVGGHCLAVDPWFIVNAAPNEAKIIKLARYININKTGFIIQKVKTLAKKFKKPVIGCLGLSYKPDIDDLRESPAKQIVDKIMSQKIGKTIICEPNIDNNILKNYPLLPIKEVIAKSDIILGLVNHKEFQNIDTEILKQKVVVDTCGIWG